MGDSEEKTTYTPAEINEIDRILDLMPGESATVTPEKEKPPKDDEFEDLTEDITADLEFVDEAPSPREELEDITDLISLEEEAPEEISPSVLEPVEELAGLDLEEPALAGVEEIPELPVELPEAREPEPRKAAPPSKAKSPLDELEALTSLEPESVDRQDISDDRFVGDTFREPSPGLKAEAEEFPEMPEFEKAAEKMPGEVKLEKEGDLDIGDLSDISMEELRDIPEAVDEEFPEISLDEAPAQREAPVSLVAETPPAGEIGGDLEAGVIPEPMALDELEEIKPGPPPPVKPVLDIDMGGEELAGIPGIGEIEEIVKAEKTAPTAFSDEIEPLSDDEPVSEGTAEEGVDLSARELRKLKTALMLFHPALRKTVKETILNDLLPPAEIRQLVDMIIKGKPEDNVHRFLERKLQRRIDISAEAAEKKRQVITSRPAYTKEGLDRQKRLLKKTGVIAAVAVAAFALTVMSYQFIYKPAMAKRQIAKGVALILEPGDPVVKKVEDYRKAEGIFAYVDRHYKKDYLPGYNAYGRAYFEKREFAMAYQKLQKAHHLNPADIETLNNLGYFYARVPENYFQRIRPPDSRESKLDIAIRYYQMVLSKKPNNVTALYGIGNAYMHQGEYLKARQFYENILRVDRKSVVGYAGLLNLYIERDTITEVMAVHYDLVDKKMLVKMPSSLLGKLAAYYLGKKRTDNTNIRVDYGIQSTKFKDLADNPYPAVRGVLEALHERDPRYPPLYLLYAKLSREQQNLTLMENYLKKAIAEEPNYFGALHLLGEYHYEVKEPAKALGYLKKAEKSVNSPPEFTREDFYQETESIGKTYFYMGNIFYNFFDRVKYRFGDDLEEREMDSDVEQMANFDIAREKYDLAIREGYKSSELSYNLGRIYYMKGQYEKAMDHWMSLYEDFVENPEIMFALGNAFYHMDNLSASQGEYLKLITLFEREADKIKTVFPDREDHLKIFQIISSAYNNLGAVYQKKNNETRSSVSYWKAIDYAARINRENEFARVNLGRAFKQRTEPMPPILDENIPFSLKHFRAEMRK